MAIINRIFTFAAMGVFVAGCHATHLAAVWSDPQSPPLAFHRTVTVFVTKDETMRRTVEDRLAEKFPNATPSYRVLPSATGAEANDIVSQLREAGYDGAIVMRLVSVDDKVNYTPGTYWYPSPYTFRGYWSSSWAYPYDPGYVSVTTTYTVETQIFSLQNEKLVFGARSETADPRSVPKLVDSIMRHINDELQKRHLIA
jgi:hypothetical protein